MESSEDSGDVFSNLPLNIIECILVRLPIRDAVRTSILSSKWRYRWTTIPQLEFDEMLLPASSPLTITRRKAIKFIHRVLLLHNGPILKFKLSIGCLQSCSDIDQWILYLSRKDIKEFTLRLDDSKWYKVPSCLFSFQQLTHLELLRCELQPPPSFKGFSNLKYLTLQQSFSENDIIEGLISSCPLLQHFTLTYWHASSIQISAPNLKYLRLEGEFKDIYLKNTPLLTTLSIDLYMTDDIAEHLEETTSCNLMGSLSCLPHLERLVAETYFVKYLSVGMLPWNRLSGTYNHLKYIELFQVGFEDVDEISVALYLIVCSPSLEELQISGSSDIEIADESFDLNFWEMQHSLDCSSPKLRTVKMVEISGVQNELEFIKFVLAKSPALKNMSIKPSVYVKEGGWEMLVELLRFPRASPQARILYMQDQQTIWTVRFKLIQASNDVLLADQIMLF
ncbi:hypothetical protein Sjap_015228 [Stephania japonica]|uniref:FBD domain-containing protein n=1 Tax=Stephania japonica TaxID=461633 RepID=A0AAP0IKB3_9MAGN